MLSGSVCFILETREFHGMIRARVALRDNAKPQGWCTLSRDGEIFLDVIEGTTNINPTGAGKSKSKYGNIDPEKVDYSLEDLHALHEKQLGYAEEVEASFAAGSGSLFAQLGEALLASKMSVAEYVGETALTKDGQITKMEFRKSVRTLLPQMGASNNSEVDAVFESLDADKGGSLDVPELKAAFQKCKDEATERAQGSAKAREKAEQFRKHASTTSKAIEATELADKAEAELKERIEHPDVEARIGILMKKRGVKIGDMVAKWDKDHDGSLDKKEFILNVTELGLEATAEELDALYVKVDTDGSGMLEVMALPRGILTPRACTCEGASCAAAAEIPLLTVPNSALVISPPRVQVPELVAFLRKNQEVRTQHDEEEKAMGKVANDRRKLAKAAQVNAYRDSMADDAERAQEEEEARLAAEAKSKAEAEALAAQKKAKKNKKKAKDDEKKQFEDKVAEKRTAPPAPDEIKTSAPPAPEAPAAPPPPSAAAGKLVGAISQVIDLNKSGVVHPATSPVKLKVAPAVSNKVHGASST